MCIGQFIGLEVVVAALHVHRREHRVRVVRQVPGGVEQPLLGDVRGADVLEALLDVPPADVVLHLPLDHPALGVEDGQAASRSRRGTRTGPAPPRACGGRAAPPRPAGAGTPSARPGSARRCRRCAAAAGSSPTRASTPPPTRMSLNAPMSLVDGRCGPAAQVTPAALAALGVEVVVDGQLAAADLHHLGRVDVALDVDQLQLERLVGQLGLGLVQCGEPAAARSAART